MGERIPAASFRKLEGLFIADANPRIPIYQEWRKVPSKALQWLLDHGLATEASMTLGGPFATTIRGYRITTAGHLAYCEGCAADPRP